MIRSKDAGVNRLTYDIIFNSPADYTAAPRTNVFYKEQVANQLGMPVEHVVDTFHVETCDAIKISIDRPHVSASVDETDVFGAQQQAVFELMQIPQELAVVGGARARGNSNGPGQDLQLLVGPSGARCPRPGSTGVPSPACRPPRADSTSYSTLA